VAGAFGAPALLPDVPVAPVAPAAPDVAVAPGVPDPTFATAALPSSSVSSLSIAATSVPQLAFAFFEAFPGEAAADPPAGVDAADAEEDDARSRAAM